MSTPGSQFEDEVASALSLAFLQSEVFQRPHTTESPRELCDCIVACPGLRLVVQAKQSRFLRTRGGAIRSGLGRGYRIRQQAISQLRGAMRRVAASPPAQVVNRWNFPHTIGAGASDMHVGLVVTDEPPSNLYKALQTLRCGGTAFHYLQLPLEHLRTLCALAEHGPNLREYFQFRMGSEHLLLTAGVAEPQIFMLWRRMRAAWEQALAANLIVDLRPFAIPVARQPAAPGPAYRAYEHSVLHYILDHLPDSSAAQEHRREALDSEDEGYGERRFTIPPYYSLVLELRSLSAAQYDALNVRLNRIGRRILELPSKVLSHVFYFASGPAIGFQFANGLDEGRMKDSASQLAFAVSYIHDQLPVTVLCAYLTPEGSLPIRFHRSSSSERRPLATELDFSLTR